ncbi:hypothetical protein K8T06_04080 [bacterium]|nr:hypothetical protein [bacterium]
MIKKCVGVGRVNFRFRIGFLLSTVLIFPLLLSSCAYDSIKMSLPGFDHPVLLSNQSRIGEHSESHVQVPSDPIVDCKMSYKSDIYVVSGYYFSTVTSYYYKDAMAKVANAIGTAAGNKIDYDVWIDKLSISNKAYFVNLAFFAWGGERNTIRLLATCADATKPRGQE